MLKGKMELYSLGRFILVLNLFALTESYSINDTKDLLTELFVTNAYDRKVRPIIDQTKEVNITISFHISAITEFNEQEESLTTAGYLSVTWTDEVLAWVPSEHNDIRRLIVPQDDIWKPDISLRNSFSSFKGLGSSYFNAWIQSNGVVEWEPFQIIKSTCSVDISFFPYDTQRCEIIFVAWSYTDNEVKFATENGIKQSAYSESSTWELAKSSTKVANKGTPTITFTLKLHRKPLFYVLNMIVPVILLSFLNIFTFALPARSGERASYSVTLFLSISVFLTIIASEFPKNSDKLSYLALYLILMASVSTIFVLVSVLQLRLAHREEENVKVGQFYKGFVGIINCFRFIRKGNVVKDQGNKSEGSRVELKRSKEATWSDVVNSIDFLCFWIGTLVIFVVTLTSMLILLNNPQRV